MNTEKLTWYAARSGGIVAWLLLALGLILGLLLSSRVLGRRASPAWLLSIHRFLGGLSVIFTVVHVAAIMLDDFVSFGWTDVLVPWASEWNPGAVAWGIIAMYLAIAIELTSFAMRRLPKGLWRGVHWLSAPLFVMATVHGYQAGTDAGRAFIIAIVAACIALAVLTVVRVLSARRATEPKTDPRVLLEQAKARRAKRDAADDTVAHPDPVATSWQSEQRTPAVVGDHAATPAPAWTDLQPAAATPPPQDQSWARPEPGPASTSVASDPPARPPVTPPAPVAQPARPGDQPFWQPAEPTAAPAAERQSTHTPPATEAPTRERPEPDQPFWQPAEPDAARTAEQPAPHTPPARPTEPTTARTAEQPATATPPARPTEPTTTPTAEQPAPHTPRAEPTTERTEPATQPDDQPFWLPAEPTAAPAADRQSTPTPSATEAPAARPKPSAATTHQHVAHRPGTVPSPTRPEPEAPIFEPTPQQPSVPSVDRRRVPELEHAGAPGEPNAPRPAWTDPDDLAWLTADAGHDPRVERRPGPVPGVWKRTRRSGTDVRDN